MEQRPLDGWGKGGILSQLFRLCDDRGLHSSAPAGVDRSGRGCNPRPARGGTPLLCPCGGGSFRSGVQPPTGSRSPRRWSRPCAAPPQMTLDSQTENKVGGLYFKFGAGVCQHSRLHFPSCARRRACILV